MRTLYVVAAQPGGIPNNLRILDTAFESDGHAQLAAERDNRDNYSRQLDEDTDYKIVSVTFDDTESKTRFSDRGIPLVYQGEMGMPILTVENYLKWYNVFIAYPDGRVETVDWLDYFHNGEGWSDHVPNPKACLDLAEHLGIEWDPQSFEMIVGRFMTETCATTWSERLKTMTY